MLFFITCTTLTAQKATLRFQNSGVYPNNIFEENIVNELLKEGENDFSLSTNSNIVLSVKIDNSKVLKLEGMATNYSGTSKILFKLSNLLSLNDTSWFFGLNIKVGNEYEINEKLLSEFKKSEKGLRNLMSITKDFNRNSNNSNCQLVVAKANKDFEDKKWKTALETINSISNSPCKSQAKELMGKIESAYAKEFCEEILPRLKILANSGIDYKMEIVIEELMKYPSSAYCKEEVLNISKTIGQHFSNKPNSNIKIKEINAIILQINGNNGQLRN